MKRIRLLPHALSRVRRRGFTLAQVEEAIRSTAWKPAEQNRTECRKRFRFDRMWNGVQYRYQEIRPIFVEKDDEIVVITVYAYFY